jgi:hypothetical protein
MNQLVQNAEGNEPSDALKKLGEEYDVEITF